MATTLIIPGYHGSEAEHWQTWMPASRLTPCLCRGSQVTDYPERTP
ncbi:alpha/beta hydrolase, partial [Ectothiorhodospira haloalkaliphila]